jgi:hypothetical protein
VVGWADGDKKKHFDFGRDRKQKKKKKKKPSSPLFPTRLFSSVPEQSASPQPTSDSWLAILRSARCPGGGSCSAGIGKRADI